MKATNTFTKLFFERELLCKIPVQLKADKNGFQTLCEIDNIVNKTSWWPRNIIVDFTNCSSFDANLVAILGAILHNKRCTIKLGLSASVKKALARSGFLKAFNVKTAIQDRENYVPYKSFKKNASEDFKQYIKQELLSKQSFPSCTTKAGNKITECIYEVYENAITHSECEFVFTCGESHNEMFDMTIVNRGTTVHENVSEYLKNKNKTILSNIESLKWAFEEGNTTKQTPGGLGLAVLAEFIDLNKGKIQMVSGDGLLEYENKKFKLETLDYFFHGTIVNLEFNNKDNKAYALLNELINYPYLPNYKDLL